MGSVLLGRLPEEVHGNHSVFLFGELYDRYSIAYVHSQKLLITLIEAEYHNKKIKLDKFIFNLIRLG